VRVVRGLALRGLACLLAGVVITVLIAWGVEVFLPYAGPASHLGGSVGGWRRDVPEGWPEPRGLSIVSYGGRIRPGTFRVEGGPRMQVRQGMHMGVGGVRGGGWLFIEDDPRYLVEWYDVGWPIATMRRPGEDDTRPFRSGVERVWARGIPVGGPRTLPLAPAWPGFAWSTLVAGGGVGLLWTLVWLTRHRITARRRKRGACPACGYVLAGLGTCPECGAVANGASVSKA